MKILVISTWFPYPLSQGSKIRAYYLIRSLAEKHEIVLCAFEDTPLRPEWTAHMREICQRVEIVPRNPFAYSQTSRVKGWFSLDPSAVSAGYSPEMERCAAQVAQEEQPDMVLAFTFVTAPYALSLPNIPKIIDVDNFLSKTFFEDFQKAKSPLRKARRWFVWKKFERYERKMCRNADCALVVSKQDQADMQKVFALPANRVRLIANGVDTQHNVPGMCPPKPNQLVFNGSITYQANRDALIYFLTSIFPLIRQAIPEVQLLVTGKTDGVDLSEMPNLEHVTFTGYLEDVRPAVAGSWVCTVPLRIGSGTRLKILEAMALGTPVVTTPKGMEGLEVQEGTDILVADTAQAFADYTIRLLNDPQLRSAIAKNAAAKIRAQYDWQSIGNQLLETIEEIRSRVDTSARKER